MASDDSTVIQAANTIKLEFEKNNSWDNLEFSCRKKLGGREIVVIAGQEIDSNKLAPLIKRIVSIFENQKESLPSLFTKINNTELKYHECYKNLYFKSDCLVDKIYLLQDKIFNSLEINEKSINEIKRNDFTLEMYNKDRVKNSET